MGGVWTPPLKLVDGVWFGVDGQWVGPATKLHQRVGLRPLRAAGHRRPQAASAPTSCPTGAAARCSASRSPTRARLATVKLSVDAHSELMSQYPWGFSGVTPNASDNLPDTRRLHRRARSCSPTTARCRARPRTTTRRSSAADRDAGRRRRRRLLAAPVRAPQCAASAPAPGRSDAERVRRRPIRQGHRRRAALRRNGPGRRQQDRLGRGRRLRQGPRAGAQRAGRHAATTRPASSRRRSLRARAWPVARSSPCRATGWCRRSIEWGKQNLADLTQTAEDLQIRWTNQGKQFPPPLGTRRPRPLGRRRLPGLPMAVRDRRRVHELRRASRSGSSPSPRTTYAPYATSPRSSTPAPGSSSTRRSRTGRSGSATTRRRPRRTARRPTTSTPTRRSSSRAPSRSIWRWTGDDGFRDEMYDFAKRNLQ